MGLKLVDLLRWSHEITLKKPDGQPITRDGKPVTVWQRIIGDQDLDDAYRAARAASARLRATLRNRDSDEFLSTLGIVSDAEPSQCVEIVVSASRRDNNSMAFANVERPDIPKIEEIAVDPDAPTLEEQEKFDALIDESNKEYLAALDSYVTEKETELKSELEQLPVEELREKTVQALIDVQALEIFIKELAAQKAYRGTYMDRVFREPAFDSITEFKQSKVREQLIADYELLEVSPEEIKN